MSKFNGLRVEWLEAFVRVAESEKRTAAAAEMGISQPTITKHIQRLEQCLGGRMLLADNSVPARLLPDGEAFLPVAKQILSLLEGAFSQPDLADQRPAPRVSAKGLKPPRFVRPAKD